MIDKNITTTIECGKLWIIKRYVLEVDEDSVEVELLGYATQADLDNGDSCGHSKRVTVYGLSGFNESEDNKLWLETKILADTDSEFYTT